MAGRESIKTSDVSALRGVQSCLNSALFGDWPQQLLAHHPFHTDARRPLVCTAVCAVSWTVFKVCGGRWLSDFIHLVRSLCLVKLQKRVQSAQRTHCAVLPCCGTSPDLLLPF